MPRLRQAFRSLLQTPGVTAVALLTLALGIGINTAMFSLVDGLLFRPGPFPAPDRLVQLSARTPQGERRVFSAIELEELRARSDAFAALTNIGRTGFALGEPGRPAEQISAATVSADVAATFGLPPLLGRAFAPEEFQPGRNQVVILSHAFWLQRYGGSADVLGRSLRLDGENVTVVGVMPAAFDDRPVWGRCALWRPLNFTPDQLQWRDYRTFEAIGRLRPGATPARAAAELAPLAATQAAAHPESYSGLRYEAVPLDAARVDSLGRRLSWMLLALSGFVLLIACANLANLQLARTTTRLRDFAIRAALGASRSRLVAQQLAESILLSLLGGALGLAVAVALNRVLEQSGIFSGVAPSLNGPILAITTIVSLATGVAFGLVPAWLASRTDVGAALKQQTRGATAGRGQHRLRQALIVGEVALALVLLAGAAILQRGFARLLERDCGWDASRVLVASLPIPETRIATDAKRIELFRRLEARLATLPGVEHAAIATSLPLFSYTGERALLTEGQSAGDRAQLASAFHVMVSPDFFATLGIPLVEGRLFPPDLEARQPRVVVINESLARRLWPGRSALGQRLGSMDSGQAFWAEVIGVVRDVDMAASTRAPSTPYQVYKPLVHEPWSYVNVVVRAVPGLARVEGLEEPVRRAIATVDPDLAVDEIGAVPELVDVGQHTLRLATQTLSWFAGLGLLLAVVGLYGVVSTLVAQRTGEFGIRLALGAGPADVLQLVLRQGLRLVALGLMLGLGGAAVLGRLLGAWLPRVAGLDPVALALVSLLLLGVAALACWLPARRATKVDPLIALRAE